MFTGLVESIGTLRRRTGGASVSRLLIESELGRVKGAFGPMEPLVLGESIAVNGACLTVDRIAPNGFEVDASAETLARTTLGQLSLGASVHLERATPAGGRLGGHVVLGHVDGLGRVVGRSAVGEAVRLGVEVDREIARFVAPKGSIAIDGVSLTVNDVTDHEDGATTFHVMLIPHTLGRTLLLALRPGVRVNLEVDVLARYVARQLEAGAPRAASAHGAKRAEGDVSDGYGDARLLGKLRGGGYL